MVGDFDSNILPLFFHYAEEVRVHVLLCDKRFSDKEHARRLDRGIKGFCAHYDYRPELLQLSFDEDSIESIHDAYAKIKAHVRSDEKIYLNASDGLASTLAILQPLLQKDKGIILAYDRFENSCNIVHEGTLTQISVSPMSIHEHLILKNIAYEFVTEDEAMLRRKPSVYKLMEQTDLYMQYKKNIENIDARHELHWIRRELEAMEKADDIAYVHGMILEEYCYWLVKDLAFDDVQLGVKITHNPQSDNAFENELDVLCIKDNHLHTIECKLRKHIDGEHFIYKYDSVGNLLDADGRRIILSTGGKNESYTNNRKIRKQFNASNIRRAKHAQIEIYQEEIINPKEFIALVEEFFLS